MHTQRQLGKYGFITIKLGGSKKYDIADYEALMPAACKYGKAHGKKFSVNKIPSKNGDYVLVRRIK